MATKKNEALTLTELLRRDLEGIKAAEEQQKVSAKFANKTREKVRENIWDAPDEEIWIDGITPPSFVEFVESEEFMHGELFPRQRDAIVNSVGNLAREAFYPRIPLKEYQKRIARGEKLDRDVVSMVCLLWGKGSGKDFLIAYLLAWLVYVLNSMKDPWAYFTHEYGEPFEAINVARNADQAREVFFNKLGNNLNRDCFERFEFESTNDSFIFKRNIAGRPKAVEWLRLYSRHSQSASYEGHNLLFFVMDEASGFEQKGAAQRNNTRTNDVGDEIVLSPADEIYYTLRTSASTRFGKQWLGFVISFPRVEGDFTMRMFAESQEKDAKGNPKKPYLWGDIGATWEINIRTSRDDFADAYEDDPDTARLMLECIPPPAKGGFFTFPERIDSSFDPTSAPSIVWSPTLTKSFDGQDFVGVIIDEMNLSRAHQYFAHFDPGLSGDAFAFSLSHPNWAMTERVHDEENNEYLIPQVIIDAIIVWKPDRRKRISVDFLNVNNVIMKIARSCRLVYCTADHWNSEHLKQSLLSAHVHVDFEGGNNKEQLTGYKNLKTLAYRGLLRILGSWNPEEDNYYPHLARGRDEMRRLMFINGNKIDHPPGGSKDISDTIAGAAFLASQRGLGQQAFSDWNDIRNDDILSMNNEQLFQREKSVTPSAPSVRDMMSFMRGQRF